MERWTSERAGLALVASLPLPANAINEPECLGVALSEVYVDKPTGPVSLVLESAWLPLLLADTGTVLMGMAEVEALVRYRLSSCHGEVSGWDVRADHRAGDRFALGYGLAPGVSQALSSGADSAGIQLKALVPALVWGWQRLNPPKTGWWVWPEQDRMLLGRFEAGRLVALNPAVVLSDSSTAIESVVQAESARWGLQGADEGVAVASWLPSTQLPLRTPRLVWSSVVGGALA